MLPSEEDADLPAFCRALGVPGLADIHTHFLPPRMLLRVWQRCGACSLRRGYRSWCTPDMPRSVPSTPDLDRSVPCAVPPGAVTRIN